MSLSESLAPNSTVFARGVEGFSLSQVSILIHGVVSIFRAHLSFEPAPTPAPLLEIDTVASSKLHEDAADTIVAPERRSEETRLLRTLIFAGIEHNDRWSSWWMMRGHLGSLRFGSGVSSAELRRVACASSGVPVVDNAIRTSTSTFINTKAL
jgi:hypothetical protein